MTPSSSQVFCPDCGYDLRGITSDRCPECGLLTYSPGIATSRIPWVYRNQIGRLRALWRTCTLVLKKPAWLAGECGRPIDLADALAFRRAVVIVAMLGVVPFFIWVLKMMLRQGGTPIAPFGLLAGFFLTIVLSTLLFHILSAGVASYFFHPRSLPVIRQNRAVALSYYACAPMILTAPALGALTLFISIASTDFRDLFSENLIRIFGISAAAILPIALLFWLRATLILLRRATDCSAARAVTAAVALPLIWLLLAIITIVSIPAAYAFIALAIENAR